MDSWYRCETAWWQELRGRDISEPANKICNEWGEWKEDGGQGWQRWIRELKDSEPDDLTFKERGLFARGCKKRVVRKPLDWTGVMDWICLSSVQSLSRVRLFVTLWIAACQASLSITNSWNSLRLTSIESVTPSSYLILCCPLLLLPPIPPSIRVFSNESTLPVRWPKYWSFSFSIIPSKEIPGLISFRMDWLDLLAV